MAEEPSEGGWWSGWLQAAKEKSASALEFMKHDLTEFSTTVQHDTTRVAENIRGKITHESATTATEKVKAGVSSLWGGISKVLIIEPEDKHDPGIPVHIFSRAKARLHAIQLDPATYCDDPTGPPEEFQAWLEKFDLDSMKGDISELLVSKAEVRSIYTQMVPSAISHANFWQRYFYKMHQLKQDEARKEALKKRADESAEQAELEWDGEDDWCDIGAPSSPPKYSVGHMEAAAALAQQTKQEMAEADAGTTTAVQSVVSATTDVAENKAEVNTTEKGRLKGEDAAVQDKASSQTDSTASVSKAGDDGMSDKMLSVSISEPVVAGKPAAPLSPGSAGSAAQNSPHSGSESSHSSLGSGIVVVGAAVPQSGSQSSSKDSLSSGMVVVNSTRTTPSLESTNKESSGLDDEWEQDFDLNVTEEDIRMAEEAASKLEEEDGANGNDWENWE